MKQYIYETHTHTKQTSLCSRVDAKDYISFYKNLGYQGIFITDHFFNGNIRLEQGLNWQQKVESFCSGYEVAKAEGEKQGLDVFFGFEYSYGWCHLLVYGLSKQWLLDNEETCQKSVTEFLNDVHRDGGFVVHAHPFRKGIDIVRLLPDYIDAVEVKNASQPDWANERADIYANMLKLPKTAGSDIHYFELERLAGIESDFKFTCEADYLKALKERSLRIFTKDNKGE